MSTGDRQDVACAHHGQREPVDAPVSLRVLVLVAVAVGGAVLVWRLPGLAVPVGAGAAVYVALDRLTGRGGR